MKAIRKYESENTPKKKDEHENHQNNLDEEDIKKRMKMKTIRTLGFGR
jgi:hypothetical protein